MKQKTKIYLNSIDSFIRYFNSVIINVYKDLASIDDPMRILKYKSCDCHSGCKYEVRDLEIVVCSKCFEKELQA